MHTGVLLCLVLLFPVYSVSKTASAQTRAVDTTFVQYYPTLFELATKKGTMIANYLKDQAASTKK